MKKLTFIILCLKGCLLSFNVSAASALIPSISLDFGISKFLTANIIWVYMLTYGLTALLYGPLIRVFDARKVGLVCVFFFSLANLIAGFSKNISTLLFSRFLMGFFGASIVPLFLIIVANELNTKRATYTGLFFSFNFASSLLGLFLSGLCPWRLIFLIPAIVGFLICLLMYFYLPSFNFKSKEYKINYILVFRNKTTLYLFLYIFLVSMFYHGIQQWLPVYFSNTLGFGQFLISMLIILTSFSGIFGETIGGYFADKIGRREIINFGIILMLICIFFLILKGNLIILMLAMVFWGFGWTFNHAGLAGLITDSPKEFLNEVASLNSSLRFISGGVGVKLAGLLMERSFSSGFFVFGLLFFSLLLFNKKLIFIKKREV